MSSILPYIGPSIKKYPTKYKVYCSLKLNLEGGGGFVLLYFMKMLFQDSSLIDGE